ncbi:MAG: transcriptional repressor [Bacteroidales bacterium]|nr:transcriptional repressor [Bacteroidales bacterium]MDD7088185.1 transcriptional repressor [Bacteroidales bacterium]MDY2936066.1 transcriptional repressor [Candidatus Cryptobacteroides sp.]
MTEKTCKAPDLEKFRALLKKYDLKVTPQRIAVHEAMLALGHASADMVTEYIITRGKAKVTVASVYNILSQLTMLGIYNHRMSSNNKMYFDVNTFKHFHLYDTENNCYVDVVDDELQKVLDERLMSKHYKGYKVDDIDVQILCHPTTHHRKVLS